MQRKWTPRLGILLAPLAIVVTAAMFSGGTATAGPPATPAHGFRIIAPLTGRILAVNKTTGAAYWVPPTQESDTSIVTRWHTIGKRFRYVIQATDPTVNICLDSTAVRTAHEPIPKNPQYVVYGHPCGGSHTTVEKPDYQIWQERRGACGRFGFYSTLQNTTTSIYISDTGAQGKVGCGVNSIVES